MCKFKAFWKDAETSTALNQAAKWRSAVRDFIATVVSTTCRSINKGHLAELMNLKVEELDAIIKEKKWQKSKENKDIIIVSNISFESRVEVKPPSKMNLDQYRTLFTASFAA
jgi:hypothetical protein